MSARLRPLTAKRNSALTSWRWAADFPRVYYQGGLPGDGWDGDVKQRVMDEKRMAGRRQDGRRQDCL